MPLPRTAQRRAAVLSLALAAAAVAVPTAAGAATAADAPDLGSNVVVFDPSMPQADIQARVDAVTAQQVDNQFGTERVALLFKPGTYGSAADPLRFQVGYYTEVAGLGQDPGDVVVNGAINVYNRCETPGVCFALDNFWRSLSNLTINPTGGEGCQAATQFWAVSQASPMRRVQVNGKTSLMDYCSAGPQYASGGYIADSVISHTADPVISGSQQQFYTRNSVLAGGWSNGVWNQVFSGDVGAPAETFPTPNPYTVLDTTPVSREKPYLYVDDSGEYRVFVPAVRRDSTGPSWQGGHTAGRSQPLSEFFVAKPGDSVQRINAALADGKDLLLTPGVYDVDRSIAVTRADTVVLGLGLATLTAQKGAVALTVADVPGVDIAGITVDAGPVNSPALMRIGTGRAQQADPANPTALQDVFFRIGGPHVGKATTSLVVNRDQTVLDDIWAWRADHGTGVGWKVNTADTGLVVNGDDVTATGLFVEHYQKTEVLWNGERGRTVFFQNEMPYDAPTQSAWRRGSKLGYVAYRVGNNVEQHEAWGLGSYIYTNINPDLHATNAFHVPVTPGVRMHHLLTVSLNKAGTIDHVINGLGAAVTPDRQGPEFVADYPAAP